MPFVQQYNGKVIKECIQKYEQIKSFRKVEKLTGVGKSTINRWYVKFKSLAYNIHTPRKKKYKQKRKKKFPNLDEKVKELFECPNIRFISKKDIVNRGT